MRTLAAAFAALLSVLGAVLAGAGPLTPSRGTTTAAEYCVISYPIYYNHREIWSGGEYCVPGP